MSKKSLNETKRKPSKKQTYNMNVLLTKGFEKKGAFKKKTAGIYFKIFYIYFPVMIFLSVLSYVNANEILERFNVLSMTLTPLNL